MIRIPLVVIILFFVVIKSTGQEVSSYKECVKRFYYFLLVDKEVTISDFSSIYSNATSDYEASLLVRKGLSQKNINELQKEIYSQRNSTISSVLLEMKKFESLVTQDLDYNSIIRLVELSEIFDEGSMFSMLVQLNFPNKASVYFELNKDTPKMIQYIWLPNGESLGDLVQGNKHVERLERPGIINRRSGYVQVRNTPDKNAPIVGKVYNEELFYYTPDKKQKWWPIYFKKGGGQIGYINSCKIIAYSNFPRKLKEEVTRSQSGF